MSEVKTLQQENDLLEKLVQAIHRNQDARIC